MGNKNTSVLRYLQQIVSRLSKRIEATEVATTHTVHNMDIYASDEDPDLDGDYIWINTNINQFNE